MEVTLQTSLLLLNESILDANLSSKFRAALNTVQTITPGDAQLADTRITSRPGDDTRVIPAVAGLAHLEGKILDKAELLMYVASKVGFFEAIARASDSLISFDKRLKNISGAKADEQQDA